MFHKRSLETSSIPGLTKPWIAGLRETDTLVWLGLWSSVKHYEPFLSVQDLRLAYFLYYI